MLQLPATVAFCAVLALSAGCSSRTHVGATDRGGRAPSVQREYPRGRWRMASFGEIERTVLWVSHILIRSADASPRESRLRPYGWTPDGTTSRSAADARALAEHVAVLASAHPESFAQLAAQYSEDPATRRRGGSLGARSASALPSRFLDAIEVMVPGETSQVVSTTLGYHVLLWRNPVPELRVAGRRIVVRYRGTLGRGSCARSREEALGLARRILEEEARAGAPFDRLIARHSEGGDRALGGDLGTWSTREPSLEPAILEALADVRIGDVIDAPIESSAGFSIVQRTTPAPRSMLGADMAVFGFDRDDPNSVAEADKRARELIAAAQRTPDAIHEYTRSSPQRFVDGHFEPTLTSVLRRLAAGELTATPVELDDAYVVMRRVTVDAEWPEPSLRYDLPNPRVASLTLLDDFIRDSQPEQLTYSLTQIRAAMEGTLTSAERAKIDPIWRELEASFKLADTAHKRTLAYRSGLAGLHRELSEARYAQVTGILQRWVSEELTELDRP